MNLDSKPRAKKRFLLYGILTGSKSMLDEVVL